MSGASSRHNTFEDPAWIHYAAAHGMVGLTVDDAIRYPPNKQALVESKLQVFCFPNGNLTWKVQVGRILSHLDRMERYIAEVPGAWLAKVYQHDVEIVWPPEVRTIR